MAVTVYVYLFPQFCLIGVHMPISGLFPLFYWCNSMYMPNARVSVCTVRRPACWEGVVECQRGTSNTLGSPKRGLFELELLYLGVGYCKGSGFV